MPRPAKHTHRMEKQSQEMRPMNGWIVRVTYFKCTWPRCQHRTRRVKKLEKL